MKKFILLLLFIAAKNTTSQNGWNAYISNNSATFLVGIETTFSIDKFGNKWIGFTNSLATSPAAVAKYNVLGGFWTYYCSSNTPAFPSNRVNAIASDTMGNVYFGTIAGLVKYDGVNFTKYTTANGLPDDNILSIDCIGNMVYIGTNNGLCRYNGAVFYTYNTSNSLLCNDTINCIKAETPTQVWLGTAGKLIELNFNSSYTFSNYNLNNLPFSTGKTNCIYIDNLGKKWIGTGSKGVIEFDNINFTMATNTYSDIIGAYLPSNCVDICRGPNNGVLFSTSCGAYSTPSGSSGSCLLELLPNQKHKVYYVSNSNYSLGNSVEMGINNEIFVSHSGILQVGNFIKFMYSLKPNVYNPFMQGTGGGVTNANFKYLDINRVKAGIANRGDMFWDLGGSGNAKYEVPKGSGVHAGFAKCLWIGGLDPSNQLHIAAQTYRQNGNDFWPGPLDTVNVSCDSSSFIQYDKIWKISYNDINDFRTNFLNGNIANNTYTPTLDIITWPAKGSGNHSRNLAPFIDMNNNGIYDPLTGGDYPQIKGDQTLYFIFNDKFAGHTETWGAPLGLEIHVMAYAYGCPNFINGKNELAYTTFYNYKIYNRSNTNYHDAKIGFYDGVDLGNYLDDFIGCHVPSNLGFSYNADNYDESNSNVPGYLNYPPAAGTCILKGPKAPVSDGVDNDNDGLIDNPGEECLMNQFIYYNSNFSALPNPTQNPTSANQYFNYLNTRWRDSSNFTCGGNAFGGTTPTKFVYPWTFYTGMPCPMWADGTNPKGDRLHIISMGPFNLNAHQSIEAEFAQVWAVDSSSIGNNFGAVNKLITNAQKITAFYRSTTQSTCLPNMAIGVIENSLNTFEFNAYPNPSENFLTVQTPFSDNYLLEITDVLGQSVLKNKISASDKTTLNVSHLKSGVYLLHLTHGNLHAVKKLIKE